MYTSSWHSSLKCEQIALAMLSSRFCIITWDGVPAETTRLNNIQWPSVILNGQNAHTHRLPMSISSQSSGVQRSAHMSFLLTYLFLYPTYYSTVITCDDNKVTVYCTYYLWHCSASIHQRLLCYLGLYSFFSPQNQLQ